MVVAGYFSENSFRYFSKRLCWPRAGTPGAGHRGSLGSHIFPASSLFSLCCLCALTLVLQVLMKSSGNNPVCVTGTMGLLVRAGGLWSQS